MFKSIQWKIIALFLLLTVTVMIVVGTFLLLNISNYYQTSFVETLSQNTFTEDMVSQLQGTLNADEPIRKMRDILDAYSSSRIGLDTYRHLFILDGKSAEILYSDDSRMALPETTPSILSAMAGEVGYSNRFGLRYMDYAQPVIGNGNQVEYIIYIYDSKEDIYHIMSALFNDILVALLFGIAISAILGFFLSKSIIAPISTLQANANRMANGDFETPISVNSDDEIGMLTMSFNNMANDLNQMLAEIESEKNKSDTILSQMTDGVLAFDATGAVMHINPAAEMLLGKTADEINSFDALFEPFHLNLSLDFLHFLEFRRPVERDLTIDGRNIKAFFSPFRTETHGWGGVVVVLQDMTKRLKLDISRREFVANVSHELRTPLTTIKSYTETLLENQDPETDAMNIKFLGTIDHEVDRMTHIVKDLLALSRLDNKDQAIKKTNFDLSKLVTDTVELFTLEARKHGQLITLSKDSNLPAFYGDKARIEQVLTNLLSNAIKYSPNGSKIEVTLRSKITWVYLVVSDNGIGIPKEDVPHVFERFYRVDKARSRDTGGTGLGLAIVKEIVEQHEGEISIRSQLGKGTTVLVKLPIFSQ